MKRALLLANGEWEGDQRYFQSIRDQVDTLVCADGGAEYALQLGLTPDRIFGDLDSIDEVVKEKYEAMGMEFVLFPVEKDKTDTHLVMDYLITEGFEEILIGGALGGRPDHLMGNLMMLTYAHQRRVTAKLISPTVEVQVVEGEMVIEGHLGDTFSLIPVDSVVRGVDLIGFKYPLHDAVVERESTLGISNLIVEERVFVRVGEGRAFAFVVSQNIV